MKIRFNEKPSREIIDKYCKKLEYFLSGIGAKVNVEVYDISSMSSSSIDGILTSQERWWLGDFTITTPLGKFKMKSKPRFGIDDAVDDHEIWSDAWSIQNAIYSKFKLPSPDPNNSEDPYWNLWKLMYGEEKK